MPGFSGRSKLVLTQVRKNVMALSQRYLVGSKAEAIDEDGVWCVCAVEEVEEEEVIISYDGWHVEWYCHISDPCEICDQLTTSSRLKCVILRTPLNWGSQNYTL